jgi:hypothetical protein
LALVLAAPGLARAQTFEYGKREEVKEVEWKAQASAGLVLTTGNSRTFTLSGGAALSRKDSENKLSLEGNVAYARSSILVFNDANGDGKISQSEVSRQDSETAKNWLAKLRYDRFFTPEDAAFLAAKIGADTPAGKTIYGGVQVGYSRQLYKDDANELVAEAGYDFTYQVNAAPPDYSIHSLRLYTGFTSKLSPDTGFLANVEGLFNLNSFDGPQGNIGVFQDTRINAKAALTTKLFTQIDFRVAFLLKFDNAPAAIPPGKLPFDFVYLAETVDTQTEASLIVHFL